jgi:hypothetical protein
MRNVYGEGVYTPFAMKGRGMTAYDDSSGCVASPSFQLITSKLKESSPSLCAHSFRISDLSRLLFHRRRLFSHL